MKNITKFIFQCYFISGFSFFFLSNHTIAQNWQALGSGTDVPARKIFGDSITNKMYAIGEFNEAGGLPALYLAFWDGTSWNSICDCSTGPWAITLYNNEIYFGGNFWDIGGKPIRGILKWDGVSCDSLSIQPFNVNQDISVIYTMTSINNELFVGGIFDTIAGIPVNSIAKWNGSNWSSIEFPSLYSNDIYSICAYMGELYVGGDFYSGAYPNDTIGGIIRYDGISWKSVGGGFLGGMTTVNKMIVYKNELYVAGFFSIADGNPGNYIAKWDGTNWSDVGGGVMGLWGYNGQIFDMAVHNDELYVVGAFVWAGGVPAQGIAKWNGADWCALGGVFDSGCCGGPGTLTFFRDTLFIAGGFKTIDGDTMNFIAKWIGGNYVDTCGNTSSVDEKDNEKNAMSVYPNPITGNEFTVSFPFIKTGTLQVINILGETLCTYEIRNTNKISINGDSFKSGCYLLRVKSDNSICTGKFMKD